MNLNKNPNHEIYLRGRMSKNPYCIKDLGNSMRSVLEKICLEHEMTHATDLIEMLVANNIIVPDLPVHLVYEKVWYPYVYKQRNPDEYEVPPIDTIDSSYKIPMEVIYRLTGVDGEASENRVESLQEDDELAKDPEKKYALAKTLSHKLENSDKTGLSIMLNDFKKVDSIKRDSYLLTNVLQMLTIALKLKDNIKEVIRINGADILVDKLFTFLSEDINEEQQQLLNQVIASLEVIVVEGSKLALEEDMEVDTEKKEDSTSTLRNVTILLEKIINACETMVEACRGIQNTSDQIIAISRILPYLTNNNKEAEQKIADLIAPNISSLEMLSEDNQKNYRWEEKFRVEFYCERFLNFLESAQNSVKQTFTKNGIAEELCKYLGRTLTDQLIENEDKLLRQKKPLSLSLKSLTFYLKSNALSQEVIYNCNKENHVLEQIFKLSKTRLKERNLSILAEGVIEAMTFESEMNDKTAHEFVKDLVNQKDLEKKKKAERKKKAMLAKMKKPGALIKKKFKLEEVKDEKGITCIICQEGYQENDKDLLGIYVFVKKNTMSPDKVIQHSEELGYTTVTHFNCIHFKCHRNAYDADCNRKKPLREWEGAQIRNSHTKCNALFPIKGGSITESSYGQYVSEYLNNLAYNVFQVSSYKVRVMFYDLKNLLKKLAFEESFSKDSLGGGAEHNINLIPFMIHMTLTIMKDNGELLSGKQQENVDKFLTEALTKIEEMKKFQNESEIEEQKMAEEIEEEVKFMGEKEDVDEEDFDSLAKSVNEKLEAWMYWALVSCITSSDSEWEEQKGKFNEVSKILAKMNSKFLPAPEKIFILSESTREKQTNCSSKSTINKYANSAKKVIIYLALIRLIRNKFIKGSGKNLF